MIPTDFSPAEWLTTSQAAELMGYNYAHVRYLVRKGLVVGFKLGRDWLVRRDSALAYLEEITRLGPAKHDPWRSGARQQRKEET